VNQKQIIMSTDQVIPATTPFKVKGDWSIQAEKLKAKFPVLTDMDLKFETGKEKDLLDRVGKRLNKTLEETTAILEKAIH